MEVGEKGNHCTCGIENCDLSGQFASEQSVLWRESLSADRCTSTDKPNGTNEQVVFGGKRNTTKAWLVNEKINSTPDWGSEIMQVGF